VEFLGIGLESLMTTSVGLNVMSNLNKDIKKEEIV
jgi:hypothetical protein